MRESEREMNRAAAGLEETATNERYIKEKAGHTAWQREKSKEWDGLPIKE